MPLNSVYSGVYDFSNGGRWYVAKGLVGQSGTTTFNITTDATPSGTSFFASIANVNITAASNSTTTMAFGTLTAISADLRQITVQAMSVRLGSVATVTFAPSGTTIYCSILGDQY